MRVFVAGGTGVLGRRLLPQLRAAGHPVTATTSPDDKLGLLARLGTTRASATVLAVEQRATGVFDIGDDEPAPASEWPPHPAVCAGAKRPMRVPTWLARLVDTAVIMMTEGRGFSNAKAERELGPRYPTWRHGFEEGLA